MKKIAIIMGSDSDLPVVKKAVKVLEEFNAVYVKGNLVGKLMFYGPGAGPLPTGSAVLGDVTEIAKAI